MLNYSLILIERGINFPTASRVALFAREHVFHLCWLPKRLKAQPKATVKDFLDLPHVLVRVSDLSCGLSRSLSVSRDAANSASPWLQVQTLCSHVGLPLVDGLAASTGTANGLFHGGHRRL